MNSYLKSFAMFCILFNSGCSTLEAEANVSSPCQIATISRTKSFKTSQDELLRLIPKYKDEISYREYGNEDKMTISIATVRNDSEECKELRNRINNKNKIPKQSVATNTNLGLNNANTYEDKKEARYQDENSLVMDYIQIDSCSPLAYRIKVYKAKKSALKLQKKLQKKLINYEVGVKYYKNQKKYKVYVWGFESKEEILSVFRESKIKIKDNSYIEKGLNICNESILNDFTHKIVEKEYVPSRVVETSKEIVDKKVDIKVNKKDKAILQEIDDGLLDMCTSFEKTESRLLARGASEKAIDKIKRDLAKCLKKKKYFETLK